MDINKDFFDMCVSEMLPDEERTPANTVVEFIKVYNKFAKHCHNIISSDRDKSKEILRHGSDARKVMQKIFRKYCTSRNRGYSSTGYFYFGAVYNASSEIITCTQLTNKKVEIVTSKVKNVATAKKYLVIKQGNIWRIDSVEYMSGKWKLTIYEFKTGIFMLRVTCLFLYKISIFFR